MELQSIRNDGRLSIEHQLTFHVNDLQEVYQQQVQERETLVQNASAAAAAAAAAAATIDSTTATATDAGAGTVAPTTTTTTATTAPGQSAQPEISLLDVLHGLRYVMDYRIRGGKQPNLDLALMRILAKCLLLHMKYKEEGLLLRRRMSAEADLSFQLFGEFIEEVHEFRQAVAEIALVDLRYSLKIHRRVTFLATEEQKQSAVAMLLLLTTFLPAQFADWRELVKQSHQETVASLMEEYASTAKPKMPQNSTVVFPPPALYFDRRVERVLDMFKTSVDKGLASESIAKRLEYYGRNDLPPPAKPSLLIMLWKQLTDFMVIILIVASTVAGIMGDLKSCVVLLVVVVLNVIIGFSQEFKANRALEALLSLSVPKATVIRDGKQETIHSGELVPGDVVVLEEGDAVPADLRLVEVSQLEVIESILTGESVAVAKKTDALQTQTRKLPLGDCLGNAYMSTLVARGRAKGVVVRTGQKTEIGKISKAISSTKDVMTPMQIRLQRLGIYLVIVSVLLCALVVVIGLARGRNVSDIVFLGVTLAVSVIPEGLVAVVTVTMAIGVRRMAKRDAIVRKLSSVETLGSVTVICSDKTGTLTEGKMSASEMWTTDDTLLGFTTVSGSDDPSAGGLTVRSSTSGSHVEPVKELGKDYEKLPLHLVAASAVCALCNNSNIVMDNETKKFKFIGDPTEIALLAAANKSGLTREFWSAAGGLKKLGEYAFDSDRKLMSILYDATANTSSKFGGTKAIIYAKGAPEAVLSRCKAYLHNGAQHTGESQPLNDEVISKISTQSSRMASSGLRVLGLACRPLESVDVASQLVAAGDVNKVENDLVFIGLIGLIDPPREGVKESVAVCKKAGIKVIMITGDHIVTALAIATSLGILEPHNPKENRAMKGVELDLLSDEALNTLKPFPNVFARVSPDNKLRIVNALQKQGDGVNDAPAIKAANVGVAMGQGGTEITKQAADIVLANDNFSTIEAAVEEGRHVFDNILKFILYLLSCNFAEIFIMLVSIASGLEAPFTPIMILFANIIADVPPSMAMGVEPTELNIMERRPRDPKRGVMTKLAVFVIAYQSIVMGMLSLGAYMIQLSLDGGLRTGGERDAHAQTLAFVSLTILQLAQAFLSRSVEMSIFRMGVFGNKYMVAAFLFSFSVLMLAVYAPPIASYFQLQGLVDWLDWVIILVMLVLQLILSETLKVFMRALKAREETRQQSLPLGRRGSEDTMTVSRFLWFLPGKKQE